MGLFDKLKENKRMKEQQRLEFEKNNVVAFMCQHLRDKNTKLCYASQDSRGIWKFTCSQCGKQLNYENVACVSLVDVINLHLEEMKNLENITDNSKDWKLTEEMEDNIIKTNISRNDALRSDITGIKINVERRFE